MRRRTVFARTLALAGAAVLSARSSAVGAARADSPADANKDLIRRVIAEAFNEGNLDVVDEALAADYVEHQAGPDAAQGPEAFKAFVRAFRDTFPDVRVELEDLVAEGERIALRAIWRGSHQGALGAIPATGLAVEFGGYHIYRFEDGKIAEHWGLQDDLSLLLQLGVLAPEAVPPTPGAAVRS